jgi:hypothetical protein
MAPLAVLLALVGRVVFSFVDPAITESSGLVDLGSIMVTTNDSGGDPLVFVIDPRSGRTVGRTTFTDAVTDVEALAPAGGHAVWVGDIGDNDEQRASVQVYRVPVARGDRRPPGEVAAVPGQGVGDVGQRDVPGQVPCQPCGLPAQRGLAPPGQHEQPLA